MASVGGALYVWLGIVAAFAMPPGSVMSDYGLVFLIATLGALIGGSIGALISPSESGEKDTFKAVLGIASAVLTGVVWKAFEPELHFFFANDLPKNSLVQVRFFAFAVATFLGAFVMYAYRAYGSSPEAERLQKSIGEVRTALAVIEKYVPSKNDG